MVASSAWPDRCSVPIWGMNDSVNTGSGTLPWLVQHILVLAFLIPWPGSLWTEPSLVTTRWTLPRLVPAPLYLFRCPPLHPPAMLDHQVIFTGPPLACQKPQAWLEQALWISPQLCHEEEMERRSRRAQAPGAAGEDRTGKPN